MGRRLIPLLLALLLSCAQAQDRAEDQDVYMLVHVTGVRAVPWKSYQAMRAAAAAYEEHKALAPDAVFSFAVMPPAGIPLPPHFKLRVRTRDGQEFPIALQNGELFQLPALPAPDVQADVVSNFKGGPLRIGLLVHTRSVAPENERLGDVRLRCYINVALGKADASDNPGAHSSGIFRQPSDPCRSPRTSLWHHPRAPTSGATIVEGGRREALSSNGSSTYRAYRLPLAGPPWSDDAIIEFAYTTPQGKLTLSEVAIYQGRE